MPVDNDALQDLAEQRRRREEERKAMEEQENMGMGGDEDMERQPFIRRIFGNLDEEENN